ncbi:protocadherin-7-like isoform X2 [Homarus americanus]|uniref:protocadherin-7-like isoform X2 n=1 Tax=Homarus americanus TaxID=6706 RepID=UPI001C43D12C|nr:protocadherin-7-like isoform X2 [Homarus americanus]
MEEDWAGVWWASRTDDRARKATHHTLAAPHHTPATLHRPRHCRSTLSHLHTSTNCPLLTNYTRSGGHILEQSVSDFNKSGEWRTNVKQSEENMSLWPRVRHWSLGRNNSCNNWRWTGGLKLWRPIWTTLVVCLSLLLLPSAASAQDSRCFLSQGGSVENFFIRESLGVGSVIGTLRLEGDASASGDIYLRLKEKNSPVQISSNSKNLTLTRKLDKEGKEGEAHVVVNVICDRRGTTDPSITIPVNIRVTDDNDNAPIFINSPYYVNVSEVTVVGTVIVGDILAKDEDQQGPFSTVQYSIKPGPYSDMFTFESPLSGSLVLRKPLDFESLPIFNVTIIAQDQAAVPQSSSTILTVQVQDADDQNPAFIRDHYMAVLPDNSVKGTIVELQPETVKAVDRDKGIMASVFYSFRKEEEEALWFTIDPKSGVVSLAEDLPDDQLNQPTTLVVRATQVDNPDRYALTTVTLSRRGYYSTQLQFIQRDYVATVLENLPRHSLIAPTMINKNIDKNIKFSLERDGDGVFRISPSGQILLDYDLDFETKQEYNLKVYVNDGEFNDTATLKVQVLNINDWDPRFRFPQYEFFVTSTTLRPGDAVGNVEVADGDRGDQITLTVLGQDAKMFAISSDGELRIRDLTSLNSTVAHIVVLARDSGIPPRTASAPISVTFPEGLVRSSPLGATSSFLLMVIFGALLGIFVLIIICLAIYIHKNKKCRDDNDAALPTKMSQIVTNNIPHTKLDPLSPLNHQMQGNGRQMAPLGSPISPNGLVGIEMPSSENNNTHTTNNNYNNGSVQASTISVRSGALGGSAQGSRRYLKNPLANGSFPVTSTTNPPTPPAPPPPSGNLGVHGDGLSLNGTVRSSTTASTVSLSGTPEPPGHNIRSLVGNGLPRSALSHGARAGSGRSIGATSRGSSPGGSARAVGGLPVKNRVSPAPTPPAPANTPYPDTSSSPGSPHSGSSGPLSTRVAWPHGSIPKRVKKLSWEDELSNKTELDPEVSVTPMPQSLATDTPNLTVYF